MSVCQFFGYANAYNLFLVLHNAYILIKSTSIDA